MKAFVASTILFLLVTVFSSGGQSILNGSFENNTAGGDQINLSNATFNSMMPNCTGFGTFGDIDIITTNFYCGLAQDGNWYVAFTGTGSDAIAMSLSSPFLAGVTYTVSFYDRGCTNWVPFPFDLGISNDSTIFGTSILSGTQIPVDGVWSQRSVTFTAPFTANYLTVIMNGGGLGDWAHIDNFCINNCSVIPIALFSAPNHICPGTCTNFTNLSQNGLSYLWSFPGATPPVSTDINPASICYNTPGTYPVSLIVNGASTSDTLTLNNYITVYPFPAPQGIMQSGDTLIANQGAVSYQWYYDGSMIPGATEYYYVAPQGGNYNVVATDANNCEVEAAIFDVVASVQNISSDNEVWVMPNPFTRSIKVMLSGRLSLYDNIGQKIFEKEITERQQTIDLSALSKGIYFLQLDNGNKIIQLKIVKM